MAEWNLSVRLTGQGSDLARTLRGLSREANAASRNVRGLRRDIQQLRRDSQAPIRVRLSVDARRLRSDVRAALTTAGSGQGIGVRLDVDAAHLRADVSAALAAAGSGQRLGVRLGVDASRLRADVSAALSTAGAGQGIRARLDIDAAHLRADVSAALSSAGAGQGLAVNQRLGHAMQLRREVDAAVRWAAWGHRIEIPIGLADRMSLRREVSDAVRWASMSQTIRVRVEPDTSALRGLGGTLSGSPGSGGGNGLDIGLGTLIPLATAAIPLIAGLTATVAPLAGVLTATGGAAAAFGIALAGQIEPLSEAADAEKKYQEAVREHGRGSTEAAEAQLAWQRQLAAMPPETQRAAAALTNLKTTFGDWSDDMTRFTMEPVTKGFVVLQELLPHLTPEVESFSEQMDRLMNVAAGGMQTPGFDSFSDKVAKLTDAKLDDFTDSVIHFLRVTSEGNAGDGALGQIIDYMRSNGPAAREAVEAIGDAVGALAAGAAEAGPTMLTLVTALANIVGALPPEAVALLLQGAAALKLIQLAGLGAAAVSGGVTRLSTAIAALGATSTAAGGGLAGFRAAVASLSTGAKFGLAAAGIGAIVLALHELSDNKPAVQVDELSTSLNTLISTGKVTGTLSSNLDEMSASIAMVSKSASDNKLAQWTSDFGTWVGLAEGPGISTARENVDAWDKSMANLVRSGNSKQAAAQYELLKQAWQAGGGDLDRLKETTNDYQNALADVAFEQEMTAQSMGVFGKAALDTSAQLDAQKQAADGLRSSILALNEVNRSAYDAQIDFEQAMDDLTASFKENGNTLDLNTEAGRKNGEAMSAAAKSQDEMIAAGLAAGESMETMAGKSDKLRASMLTLATQAFDGNRQKALDYVNTLLGTPEDIKTIITLERQDAITGLQSVQDAIAQTPDSHTVTVDTLNATAIAALEAVGLKTRQLPDGRTEVYTANGQSLGSIAAVDQALTRLDGKTARTYTTHTTTFYENHIVNNTTGEARSRKKLKPGSYADGALVDYYADGGFHGMRPQFFADGAERHVAQIAPAGSWRVWAEPETMGEAYIPLAPSKRARSRAILEETARRLGGDPAGIQWNADGSLSNWQYDPVSGSLYSPSDAASIGHKTRKVKTRGGKTKEIKYYDIAAVEKKLWDLGKATVAWNRNLEKVADRAGGDVAKALASMGNEGVALAAKMAKGTDKYVAQMSIALRRMMQEARASLKDFTLQLEHATGSNAVFQNNLVKLAAMGYGDLASHLASKGDQASMELAADAASSRSKAARANSAVKKAKAQLSSEEMESLIQIIAAITSKTVGIHQVADKTGIGEDVIIDVANKAKAQISKSLGAKATKFLADLGKANKQQAYADGGIRAGLYATQGGIIRFAEPSTRGEAYIPLGANKRRTAMPVLADVANRFGVGLTDGQSGRVVIIREQGPLIGASHFHIGDRKSDRDLARAIEQRQAYQLRRMRRGGVGARG